MRFSHLFLPTSKEAPKDAVLASHIYLTRAAFIAQIGSGIYNFLPLGKIVLDKIKAVVKEELDSAGNQEVQLGFITPYSLWKESGRAEKFGSELLRFKDRKNNDFVLGPTHEEAMVDLVRNRVKSYKNLPQNLYQINTKFRDEARPRYGLLRGREFLMKDGYSFHESDEDLDREFKLMQDTYCKIFTRLGLDFKVVEADSGAIGGSGSKEFMVLADSGEDDVVVCNSCEYGANVEVDDSKAGDKCRCGGELRITKGIEVGHIFKLGTTYSEALKATYLDRNGKAAPFIMGTYGLGVSRLVAAVVEQHHDERGIKWTDATTPFDVVVIVSDIKKEDQREFGEKIYEELKEKGLNVAIDDRAERFGFKMGDFELIGIKKAVIVGKNLKDGSVQIVKRDDLEKIDVAMGDVVLKVMEL
ncbi:MAG TPA: proline--tRNA ligase [Campylobacterales bacterium]|nr:proline--tRNA ligase [Campylobacterales bacterium]